MTCGKFQRWDLTNQSVTVCYLNFQPKASWSQARDLGRGSEFRWASFPCYFNFEIAKMIQNVDLQFQDTLRKLTLAPHRSVCKILFFLFHHWDMLVSGEVGAAVLLGFSKGCGLRSSALQFHFEGSLFHGWCPSGQPVEGFSLSHESLVILF